MPRYFSEQGRTHHEVMDKIRSKYGDNARILLQKTVPRRGFWGLLGQEAVECRGYVASGAEARKVQVKRDEETKAAILAVAGKNPDTAGTGEEKPSPGEQSPGNQPLGDVMKALDDIRTHLTVGTTPPPEPFPVLAELREILEDNEFTAETIDSLVAGLRSGLTADELEDRNLVHHTVSENLAGSLRFLEETPNRRPRVFILVGPTGVGKTTTIAKLAAVHGIANGSGTAEDVRIITIDSFRIGARAQVETYGEIMGIPVTSADDHDDLRKQIALASESDLILVDTIGKSPRDFMKLAEMRKLLEACGEEAEIHLAVSATTKTADIREITRQYEPFGYRSILLTKLDETSRIGNLLSVAMALEKPLSYLTDGQSVPVDIEIASASALLSRLRGIDFDRKRIDNRYPAVDLTAAWR